jgi:hypothetical protein
LLKHEPQFWLSLITCAQNAAPASGTHGSSPCGQPPWHLPVTHASSVLHAVPHVPQFWLSVCVSTHEKLVPDVHTVAVGAQSVTQFPFEQTLAESHVFPHEPQFCGSESTFVHLPSHDSCTDAHETVCPLHAMAAIATDAATPSAIAATRRFTSIARPTARSSTSSS